MGYARVSSEHLVADDGSPRGMNEEVAGLLSKAERSVTAASTSLQTGDTDFARGMERLASAYPEDPDARAFHALALLGTAHHGRDVPTYMRAAAEAEEVFRDHPRHPGAAHYLSHAYDDPVHAPLGLRAARAYSQIAPAAPHAQHMTSHIFVALGMWKGGAGHGDASSSSSGSFERMPPSSDNGLVVSLFSAATMVSRNRMWDAVVSARRSGRSRCSMYSTAPGVAATRFASSGSLARASETLLVRFMAPPAIFRTITLRLRGAASAGGLRAAGHASNGAITASFGKYVR
jgi:hypothetical protein